MQLDLERDDLMALLQRASAMAAHRFLDTERSALGPKLPTEDVRRLFAEPLPEDGMSWQALLAKVESEVFANSMRSTSPDFYGLVTSCGNPYGIAGELLAAGLNQVVVRENVAPAATAVEAQVLRWLAQFIGTPHEHGGVMVSGGSAANLVGLMAARCAKGPPDLADKGLSAAPPMTVYTSTGAHLCIDKAVDILGLGREQLRKIPVAEEDFRIRLDRLRAAILEDRERGARPLAIVAQGGGVNTGAVDDLNALADLCAEQDMWLHVDGAYGAPAAGTESGRPLFAGLERVDSLAIDAHKWLYVPFTASAVLVRDPLALERSFSVMADYAESSLGDDRSVHFMERGIQMSRSFAALKVWMTLRGYGARRLRDAIEENIHTMRYLGRLLEEADDFELLIPVRLSVVCFRYVPGQLDEGALDELNSAIFQRLESDGIVAIGRVTINGRTALRACSVKFRTEPEHVRHLLSVVRQAGALIVQTRSSAA